MTRRAATDNDQFFIDVHVCQVIGAVVVVVVVVDVVVVAIGTIVVVVVVIVVAPNCGRVIASKGALFGQYRDGYPN